MKPAALAGTYHNIRPVMGRKVLQVIVELPIEQMPAFVEAFGAPNPDTWIALARLNPGKEVVKDTTDTSPPERNNAQPRQIAASGGARTNRDWAQLVPSEQAGILCAERAFWKFLNEECSYDVNNADDAAKAVRDFCGVASRKEIAANHHARVLWHSLVESYRLWQRAPECVA